jgi:hypothetical protein
LADPVFLTAIIGFERCRTTTLASKVDVKWQTIPDIEKQEESGGMEIPARFQDGSRIEREKEIRETGFPIARVILG